MAHDLAPPLVSLSGKVETPRLQAKRKYVIMSECGNID